MTNNLFKLALLAISLSGSFAEARTNTPICPSAQSIDSTLSTGARWKMCWEARDEEGIVLSDVRYQAPGQTERRVLGEISLSQIQRNYDDGSAAQYVVTDSGLGGSNLIALRSSDCEGGQLKSVSGKKVLCETKKDAGYIFKYGTQQAVSGEKLSLMSASQVGNHSFIQEWLFHENGTVQPRIGISGLLDKTGSDERVGWPMLADGTVGVGFVDNYFWRMDFDLGSSSANDVPVQLISNLTLDRRKRNKQVNDLLNESARVFSPEVKRTWIIRDKDEDNNGVMPISYELVLLNYGHQGTGRDGEAWLQSDVYFTRFNACERFAVKNPTTGGCASDVSRFVNGQNTNGTDIVAWHRLTYHHLPRDEDDNLMGTRWSEFKLLPRDWHTTNPM